MEARELAHERDREALHLHQDKMKEMELGASPDLNRSISNDSSADEVGNTSLGHELGDYNTDGHGETKTS